MRRAQITLTALGAAVLLWSVGVPANASPKKEPSSVHDFKVKTSEEKDYDLKQVKGRVLMIVNVASQ